MKKSELQSLISGIVREEIRRQLPAAVERVLSERYIRRVVESVSGTREDLPPEEEVPEPQNPVEDDHDGIYHEDQPALLRRGKVNEVARRLLSRDNSLAFLYEGVEPPGSGPPPRPEASLKALSNGLGVDFGRARELAMLPSPGRPAASAPARPRPDLDVVVDTRPAHLRSAPAPAPRPPPRRNPAIGDYSFPDRPVTFDD